VRQIDHAVVDILM